MSKDAQTQALLNILLSGKSITAMQAMYDHGIGRLSARVHDLRAQGFPVKMRWKTSADGKKRYGEYYSQWTISRNGEATWREGIMWASFRLMTCAVGNGEVYYQAYNSDPAGPSGWFKAFRATTGMTVPKQVIDRSNIKEFL